MHPCLIRPPDYASYSIAPREATRALLCSVPGPVQCTIECYRGRNVDGTFENTARHRYNVVL